MAQDPSEDDVNMLLTVSEMQVDRVQAIQILKLSGNNVETAMNKIFDALAVPHGIAELLKQGDTSWDASAFGNAGYGQHYENSMNSNVPSFRIDHDVDYANRSVPISAAPTRPSSRTTQRPSSAMSTHMGDVPMQSSFYSDDGSFQNIEPLTGFSGVETGQESGVLSSTGTAGVLRPATQNYYDSASWALVPATKSTEYIPDASLDAQIRRDKPGLIKPSVSNHYLPALITILHTIPLARNALLAPTVTSSDYWRGEDWWKGAGSAPSIIFNDDPGSDALPELEFLYEVQRLIAFLDASDRTYVSLESFLQLDAWIQDRFSSSEERHDSTDVLKFLLRWHCIFGKHATVSHLHGIVRSVVNVNGKRDESSVLNIDLDIDTGLSHPTLYDYIDRTLFGDFDRAHIMEMSNVLIFNLGMTGAKRDCKVPHTLYVDRYLEENRVAAEASFAKTKKLNQRSAELDAEIEKIKWHMPQKVQYPQKMETLKLLETSMKAFESDAESPNYYNDVAVLKHLQALHDSVERKLSALEIEKEKAKEALDAVSEHFRAPIEDIRSDDSLTDTKEEFFHRFTHPYKLCGFAISKTEYFIRHVSDDPGDFGQDEKWWHIEYKYKENPEETSIDRNEVTVEQVLSYIDTFTENAILIYANETAFAPKLVPLSAELKAFVERDNRSFQQEIANEKARVEADWGAQYNGNEGNEVVGDWFDGEDGWDASGTTPAGHGYQSSKTLTPDTDVHPPSYQDMTTRDEVQEEVVEIHLEDENKNSMEMQEINGGINAWAGVSNASSETVGRVEDVQMVDVGNVDAKAEHANSAVEQRKGG